DEKAQDDDDAEKHEVHETTQEEEDDDQHDDDENDQEDDDASDDDKKIEEDDDEEMTESDNDGDDFVHPKLTTHEDEIIHERILDEVKMLQMQRIGNDGIKISNTDLDGSDKVITEVALAQSCDPKLVNPDGQQQSSSVISGFLLEDNFSEFRQTNQYADALSSIPGTVDQYLANKMQEAVNVAVQLKYDRFREESTSANQQFLNSIDDGMKKIHVKKEVERKSQKLFQKSRVKLELKRILIDKMEANNSINRSDIQKQLYKALVEAYEADQILLEYKYGKEPASTSAPSETITKTAGKTTSTGTKTHTKSASQSAPAGDAMHSTDVIKDLLRRKEFETGVQKMNA
ncbi:hypothetical protein Tco_1479508, partial [Tanacetum coccineum]